MNKKFIFLILMCLLGSLIPMNVMAQFNITYNQGEANQYTLTFTPIDGSTCSVSMTKANAPTASTALIIPETVENNGTTYTITDIPESAFDGGSDCLAGNEDNFTELTIPNSVKSIGKWAFYGWVNCESITIPNGVTTIAQEAFAAWTKCTEVVLGSGLTSIANNAFKSSNKISTIYCYAAVPPTYGGNSVFSNTVKNNATVYVPATSIDEYKKVIIEGYGWAYFKLDNFQAIASDTKPEVALNTPANGATDIFNPSLNFNVSNATGYKLFMAKGDGTSAGEYTSLKTGTETGSISYQTSNLESNTTYYWKVVATNDNGTTTTSDEYTFTTKTFGVPGAITNIFPADEANVDTDPTLQWTFGENTEQYLVYCGTDKNNLPSWGDWTNTQNNTSGSFTTSGLASNTTHYWRVDVKNSAGRTTGTVYSFYKVDIPENVTPISPADRATGISLNPTLTWTFATNTTKYRLLFGDTENGLVYELSDWQDVTDQTASFNTEDLKKTNIDYNTTYYWAVEVKNGSGSRGKYNCDLNDAATFSFTTTDIFAVTLSTENGIVTNGSANLSWTYGGKNAATHYQVYLGTDKDKLTAVTDWIARETVGTGYATEGAYTATVSENAVYYWRVDVKKGDEGEAVSSEVRSFVNGLSISVSDDDIFSTESTTVSWNAIAGATSYNVYVDSNEPINTENNSYELSGLTSGEHTITVTAVYNNGQVSLASNEATVNVTAVGILSVTVTDGTNPIEGATVTLTDTDDNELSTQTSDANGIVSFADLPTGTYKLAVSKETYNSHTEENVVINENATTEVTIPLKASVPGNVTPISPTNGATDQYRPILEWQFAQGTEEYRILMNLGSGYQYVAGVKNNSYWLTVEENQTTGTFSTEHLDLSPQTTYYWCIDVANENGKRTQYTENGSESVEVFSFTTSSIAEVNNIAPKNNSVIGDTEVELTWDYRNGNTANEYQILYGTTNPPTDVLAGWTSRGTATVGDVEGFVSIESYEATGLERNSKYYWQVNVREDNVIRKGDIWSFISTLDIPTDVSVSQDTILPVAGEDYGMATVSWNAIGGIKYNVYVNGNEHNDTPLETSPYVAKLGIGDHEIYVTAVYDGVGESAPSDTLKVVVTGKSSVTVYVKNEVGTNLEGAIVKFVNENGQSYEGLTTNSNGKLSTTVAEGIYDIIVSKEFYDTDTVKNINISGVEGKTVNVMLYSKYIFTVYAGEINYELLRISIPDETGTYYDLYIEGDGDYKVTVSGRDFSKLGSGGIYHEFDIWGTLPNGKYRFGVAVKDSDIINWSDYVLSRNYAIFEKRDTNEDGIDDGIEGGVTLWNNPKNWRAETLPASGNRIFIAKPCTIPNGEAYTACELNIETAGGKDGSMTLKGSLTITEEIFNTDANRLVLHDGAQLRHKSKSAVKATHKMKIDNPTEWLPTNKTGWQFISSMFKDAKITDFTDAIPAEDEYDFYKYYGSAELEWINNKTAEDIQVEFEDNFKPGLAYLASYKEADTATIKGTLCDTIGFNYVLPYNANKDLFNFSLIGNPFPFDMDWAKVSTPGLVPGYATVNYDGTYEYHTSGTIPAGDGFFVKAAANANFISYNDNWTPTRGEQNDFINVVASNKSGKDNVIINFAGSEKDGFPKLNNFNDGTASIFVLGDDVRYGISNHDRDVKEVELAFVAPQMGYYTISIEPSGEFESIVLVDRFTGIETDMLLEKGYKFTATSNDKYNRFVLRLGDADEGEDVGNTSFVYQSGNELIINAEGLVQIIDIMGRVVYSDDIRNKNRIDVSNFDNASYIVRLINEDGVKVQKIVVY